MIRVCYRIFNEEDYLYESVKSVYDYADEIWIYECCFPAMRKIALPGRITEDGLSADRTAEIISRLQAEDAKSKIDHIKVGFLSGDQTTIMKQQVDRAEVGDYIWFVDGDEVYPSALCEILHQWMVTKTYHAIWLQNILFWHDILHIRTGLGWERPHQRIYMKLADSMFYVPRHLDIRWRDSVGNVYGYGIPPKPTRFEGKEYNVFIGDAWLAYYHYAYIRTPRRILEKMLTQFYQNVLPNPDEWKDEIGHSRQYANALEFKLQTHPWFTNHDFHEGVSLSGISHPRFMDGNPWLDYRWNEQPVGLTAEEAGRMVNIPDGV